MQNNTTNQNQASSQVLRFITAGSVDDGKSTLIGRLLYDAKAVFDDQINAIEKSKHKRTVGEAIDFSLLTDGLASEREQGITIDVAYRYFSTAQRKFIVADAPGHEQYTRNMVTGASNSDAAIVLIDITRIDYIHQDIELLAQTKRHSAIINLLGLQHIIIAINKMDLINYDENAFNNVVKAYKKLAQHLNLQAQLYFVPISALKGDNIVNKSDDMPWYGGQSILSYLENMYINPHQYESQNAFFAVQYVMRQDGSSSDDFRGYMGRIEAGSISIGDVLHTTNNQSSTVKQIFAIGGIETSQASSGDNVTIVLANDIDISRGDVLTQNDAQQNNIVKSLKATLCWLDNVPSTTNKYILKHTTHQILAKISNINSILDIHSLETNLEATQTLKCNDIGQVEINLQKPIIAHQFKQNALLGSFILIDEVSHRTVAAGFIQ
ncbi:MAG: putative sulfate adenylyltransferase subunit 1 protein [Pseudomonadota bacterium]|jgi:sulfate adenylyltransferase subunit 1